VRTGQQYLDSLADGRHVIVDGEVVTDVTTHPAFEGIARTIAGLYDFAADPANDMTYVAPETGREALKPFMIPRTAEDLRAWRESITRWSELSHGFVGRSPDHVGAFLAGFASHPDTFDRDGRRYGEHVSAWYRRLLDESLYVTYVIIPPQVSRASTAHDWEGDFIQVGVVEERDDGIVLRGSQMLGTGTAISDHVLVSCIKPLTPDDVDHAFTAIVPISAPGLKVYCRRPYGEGQPSRFDYPMSTRFDETDALVVFDDVVVPWEDVFVCKDVEGLREQWFSTGAHVLGNAQAQIRLATKMRFLAGIARKICAVNEIDRIPSVVEKLGELAALCATVEGFMLAAEAAATTDDHGLHRPAPRFVYSPLAGQAETYPRALHILRELAGGGVIQLPSSYRELVVPEFRADMERYVQSPGTPTDERVELFKLAWDVVGSEFAGRHHQYEMFYAGAPFVAKGYAYRNYGFDDAVAEVDAFMAGYGPLDGATERQPDGRFTAGPAGGQERAVGAATTKGGEHGQA
jgi:4-hydroxyphenylacetate 3-monooxygenase